MPRQTTQTTIPAAPGITYLEYTLQRVGSARKATGTLKPMIAKDGPHYAENVRMDGRQLQADLSLCSSRGQWLLPPYRLGDCRAGLVAAFF